MEDGSALVGPVMIGIGTVVMGQLVIRGSCFRPVLEARQ